MLSNVEKVNLNPNHSQVGQGFSPGPILLSEEFFHPIISKLDKYTVLLLIDYIATDFLGPDIHFSCFAALSSLKTLNLVLALFNVFSFAI